MTTKINSGYRTNKHGDSKSDVFLCFDTKFKSYAYHKLFESDIDIIKLLAGITRKDWSSGLRRSASLHREYSGCEFESRSRISFFFFLSIFSHSFHDYREMKKVSILTCFIQLYSVIKRAHWTFIQTMAEKSAEKSNRKAMNRNWRNQKANPALKTKAGNK